MTKEGKSMEPPVPYGKESDLAVLTEAERWIAEAGSSRLKKIVAAGLLPQSLSVYRDERLAHDHPELPAAGWYWAAGKDLSAIINPAEAALDALIAARDRMAPTFRVELVKLRVWRDGPRMTPRSAPLRLDEWCPALAIRWLGGTLVKPIDAEDEEESA